MLRQSSEQQVLIHRAPWLLPMSQSPIQDGGLVVHASKILTVGRFVDLRRSWPNAELVDHPDTALLPGLINAHTHLELSHLAYISQQPAPSTFTGWIARLLAERGSVAADDADIKRAAQQTLVEQQAQGIVAIADISNTALTRDLTTDFSGNLLCFKEYLGLRAQAVESTLVQLEKESKEHACTGHAPYSTHPALLRSLKTRAKQLGHIFPIHTAESPAEIELLRTGRGELRTFLEERGFWEDSFQPLGGQEGAVTYLHQHGLLDSKTLCVHCVHLSKEEVTLLAAAGAKVCLCPGSNRYLGVGTAPVTSLLQWGILPALGTDSLTSNPEISLWREMRLLAEDHPTLNPEDILRMATLNGAAALGLDKQLGSLEEGKEAAIIKVRLDTIPKNSAMLHEQIIWQTKTVETV